MKTSIRLFIWLFALTMTLSARAQHVPAIDSSAQTQSDIQAGREALLKEFPLVRNDSVENSIDYLYQQSLLSRFRGDGQKAFQYLHACLAQDSTRAEVWSELATLYNWKKDKDSVHICVEKAHQYEPDNHTYLFNLIYLYTEEDRPKEAALLLHKYLNDNPEEYEYYYPLANIYQEAGMHKEAIEVLKQLESIEGKNQDISLNIYNNYRYLGKPKKALKEMQQLLRTDPENTIYQVLLAYAYEDLDADKAIEMYQKIICEKEDNDKAMLFLADFYTRLGKDEEAKAVYLDVLNNEQVDFRTKYSILGTHFVKNYQEKDSLQLLDIYQSMIRLHPTQSVLYKQYAIFLRSLSREEEAADNFRISLNLNPYDRDAWLQFLSIYVDKLDLKKIEELSLEAAIYFPKEYAFTHYASVVALMEQDYEKALAAYRKGLSVTTAEQGALRSDILGKMGDVHHQLGQMDSCYHYYELALAYYPENAMVLNNYAYFLSVENRLLDKAAEMAQMAVRLEGTNATYLDTYAWVFFKLGNYSRAKIYIERALLNEKKEEASPELREHYGDILWFCGEKERAVEQWGESIKMQAQPSEKLLSKFNNKQYEE